MTLPAPPSSSLGFNGALSSSGVATSLNMISKVLRDEGCRSEVGEVRQGEQYRSKYLSHANEPSETTIMSYNRTGYS